MNRHTLTGRLRATFAAELDEHLLALGEDLVALEQTPDDAERMRRVFRVAHTLKGAARAAGFPHIEQVCHSAESLLAAVRDGTAALGADDFTLLFATADALGAAQRALSRGDAPPDGRLLALLSAYRGEGPMPGSPDAADESAGRADSPGAYVRGAGTDRVRVSSASLEKLLAHGGELVVDRGRIGLRAREVEAVSDGLRAWNGKWRRTARTLRLHGGGNGAREGNVERTLGALDEDLQRLMRDAHDAAARLLRDARALARSVDDVVHETLAIRMQRFGDACEGLPRVARDLAQAGNKRVELRVSGTGVEMDRGVLDAVRAAMLPLVRNAVDHGIEPPAGRRQAGKPDAGTVEVSAAVEGDRVVVRVTDDGAGIDTTALRHAAATRGIEIPDDDRDLGRLLFTGGVTSRRNATEISGRGVGLDIVRAAVEGVHGTLDVRWRAGRGTTVTIDCPLSLAALRAVTVRLGPYALALPAAHVQRMVRVAPQDLVHVRGRAALRLGEQTVPVTPLGGLLGAPFAGREVEAGAPGVILRHDGRAVAAVVDELLGEGDLVLRGVDTAGHRLPLVSGATVLPDGRVAPVLDGAAVVAAGLDGAAGAGLTFARPAEPARRRRVLVVEDSITTRALEVSVLEAAGYEVLAAVDGADAWRRLQSHGADIVVTDVEMPRMDGFALCEAIRASARFRDLPVVLVTARESEADRRRGLAVGADTYLGKSGFDQTTLLDAVRQLLGVS